MRRRRSARFIAGSIGVIVIVLSLVVAVYALNSSKGLPGVPRTLVTMKFTDTGDIHVDSDLREADFRVGRINKVEYRGDGVGTIEAQFDDNRPVYKNATAQIVSRSGLGQKYLNINRGTPDAGQLEQNGTLPVSQTQSTAEILSLASIFDPKTQTAAQQSVEQLGAGLEGNGDALSQAVDSVPQTFPNVISVVRALNVNNGSDINRLLGSVRDLTATFQGRQQQLTDLNRQLAVTLDAVNADHGQALANLLRTAPTALPAVRKALIDIDQPLATTTQALDNIRPGVRALVDATPDVRGVLREAPRPLDKVPGVAEVGRPALRSLTPALRDLRPVVPKLRFGLETVRVPLKCLAIYDIGQFLTRFAEPIRAGNASGNNARFTLIPTQRTLVAGQGLPNPLTLPGLLGALPPEFAPERPCPTFTRQLGATDNVIPPVQGGPPPNPYPYPQGGQNGVNQ